MKIYDEVLRQTVVGMTNDAYQLPHIYLVYCAVSLCSCL